MKLKLLLQKLNHLLLIGGLGCIGNQEDIIQQEVLGGGGWGPYRSTHTEIITDAHLLYGAVGGMGGGSGSKALDLAHMTDKLVDISLEANSDKKIIENSTGENTTPTDANGGTANIEKQEKLQMQTQADTSYTIAGSTPTYWADDDARSFAKGDTLGMTIEYGKSTEGWCDSIKNVRY